MSRKFVTKTVKVLPVIIGLILYGCASGGKKKLEESKARVSEKASQQQSQVEEKSREVSEEEAKAAFKALSDRVDKLIAKAKEAGGETLGYLADDLFLKASAASINSDHLTARELFFNVLKIRPNDQYIKSRYAIELIRTGSLNDSLPILESVHKESKGKDSRIGLILAGVYSALGKDSSARKVYGQLLKSDPKDEDACIFLSKSYSKAKEYRKAIATLKKCEISDRKNPIYSYYMGKVYLGQGDLKKSFAFFKKALRIDKTFDQAAVAIGILHEEKGEWKTAAKVYRKQLDRSKKGTVNPLLLNRLVQSYFALEQFEEVIPYAEMLSDIEPDNLNVKVKLGILYTDVKKFDKAIRVFKEILKSVPEFEKSIEHLHTIEPSSDLYKDSSLQIAQMLSQMAFEKKTKEGHERFFSYLEKTLVKKYPAIVQMNVVKSNHLESLGQIDKAIDVLAAIQDHADFGMSQKYYLASLFEKSRDFKKAENIMWGILKEDSQNAHAWNFLGYSLLERGVEMGRAFEYISKAVKLSPEDGYIRDSLGWYHYKVGNFKQALIELRKASKLVSDDAVILKHIAIVYKNMKNFKLAKKFYFKALEHTKIDDERKAIFKEINILDESRTPASQKKK